MERMDPLTRTFGALADPTRRAILARLATGEATVGELAAPFDMSWPAVSRHVKVLEQAGLIERRAKARFRVCALKRERLGDAGAWIAEVRDFWEKGFNRLDALLQTETRTKGDKP